jgi:uncharacterized integral membrane protein (TIGR00697 family)
MVTKKKTGSAASDQRQAGTGRTSSPDQRQYRYYDLIMAGFVCVLLCSNLIGVSKVVTIAGFTFGGGNLFFPLSYLFGDILTEVYGYARSRRVVWAGFGSLIFASLMSWIVVTLPAADGYTGQAALEQIFGSTPRIVAASIFAYFVGELTNSYILAKMKVRTAGRFLWMRTIGSTLGGEAIDSLLFYPLAFYGTWSNDLLVKVMIANYVIKVSWEVLATPFTYRIVKYLKKKENVDYYDRDTNFTPFSVKV